MEFQIKLFTFEWFKQKDMKQVLLPNTDKYSLAFYLALEEYVAKVLDCEAFFVWRVDPTVIIGRNQVLENEVNLEYCREHKVKVVRRKSGGGCVYSDMGNIMISYVSDRGEVEVVFDRYMSALAASLCELGLPAVKSTRNDILVDGRKVSGNAFQQLPGKSIVHGTLLYSTDLEVLAEAIRPPVEKLQRHGVESVRQRVVNLQEYSSLHPVLQSPESLVQYILEKFTDGTIQLTQQDVDAVMEMSAGYPIEF